MTEPKPATFEFSAKLEAEIWEHDGVWVAYVDSLRVYSQGTSFDEACAAIQDAVRLYLKHSATMRLVEEE